MNITLDKEQTHNKIIDTLKLKKSITVNGNNIIRLVIKILILSYDPWQIKNSPKMKFIIVG